MTARRLKLLVICCLFKAKLIVRGDCSREVYLASNKTQITQPFNVCCIYSSEPVQGIVVLLCACLLLKSSFLPHDNWEQSIITIWSRLPINDRTNVKTMDARTLVLCNSVKTETVAPQNNRATEWNGTLTFYWPLLYIIGYSMHEVSTYMYAIYCSEALCTHAGLT